MVARREVSVRRLIGQPRYAWGLSSCGSRGDLAAYVYGKLRMNLFKQMLVLVVSMGFLASCSQQADDSPVANETSSGGDDAASDQGLASSYYVEYMWCSTGTNATEERIAALLADTNRLVDELGGESLNGYRLHPNGWTSDEFDYIDALWWPNKETRDAVWQAWTEADAQANIDAMHPDVEACGGENFENMWGFNVEVPRSPSRPWTWENPPAAVDFMFCSFNEGKNADDLSPILTGSYEKFLAEYEEANGPSGYFYSIHYPVFDVASATQSEIAPDQYDTVWANYWETNAEKASGMNAFVADGQEIQAEFDSVATCGDRLAYDGTWIIQGTPNT